MSAFGDGRINMPELPPGINQGVLAPLWEDKKEFARLSGVEVALYYLAAGFRTLLAIPANNVVAVCSIGFALFLFSGFVLILQNVDRIIERAGDTLAVSVYLKEDVSQSQVDAFLAQLENDNAVRSFEYVTKSEAFSRFRDELGTRSSFLAGVEEDNPLPASVDILMQPDEAGTGRVGRLIDRVAKKDIVEDVVYGSEWVLRVRGVLKVFRFVAIATLVITLFVIVFLIANTIRLLIYARRDEIHIMQLVGASDSFIRLPFIIGGLIQGLCGAVVGLFFLKICFESIDYQLRGSQVFSIALPRLEFLGISGVAAIICLGVLVGGGGSYLAVRKFMNA